MSETSARLCSAMKPAQLITAALVGSPAPGLLDDAARAAAARRATVRTRQLDAPEPAPEQDPNQPPQAFVTTVNAVLARTPTTRDPLLTEALTLLARAGMVLPTRLLVPMLNAATWNREIATALPPVLGARGRWLAGLDPRWLRGHAIDEPKPQDWDEGSLAERVAWVRHVRATDPDAGRELVAETRKEKASDRAQFVAALGVGLGLDDEELLEGLLRDRSKEVGRTAAGLLARIEGSAYLRRVLNLARACFTRAEIPAKGLLGKLRSPKPGPIVAVAPTEADVAADYHADVAGIALPKGPAGRVVALAAIMPPHHWAEIGLSVADLDPRVLLDDEPLRLADALVQATLRWGDVDAARTLLVQHSNPELVLLLPPDERDAALERVLRAVTVHRAAIGKQFAEICARLREYSGLTLTPGATAALLDGIVACIEAKQPIPEVACQLVAYAADPASAPNVAPRLSDFAHHPGITPYAQRYPREAAAILTLRQSIHESMKEPR